jgi:hypothetical protein
MSVGPGERSYLRFNLSSIPPGATVTAADLTLCRTNGSGGARTHELRAVSSAWTVTCLTWNTPQRLVAASALHTIAVPPSSGCTTSNVEEEVHAWLLGGVNHGWRIMDVDEPSASLVEFATREESNVGLRPVLSVTYTP